MDHIDKVCDRLPDVERSYVTATVKMTAAGLTKGTRKKGLLDVSLET